MNYSDITPRDVYLNRRKFLYGMGLAGGLAVAGKGLADIINPTRAYATSGISGLVKSPFSSTEKVTALQVVASYNNFTTSSAPKKTSLRKIRKNL